MNRMLYYLEFDKEVHCISLLNQLEATSTNAKSLELIIGTWQDFFFI